MFFAAGLGFFFSQFTRLLFDVADLSLQTFVLLLLSILAAAALVSFLRQLLQVLFKTSNKALHSNKEEVQ